MKKNVTFLFFVLLVFVFTSNIVVFAQQKDRGSNQQAVSRFKSELNISGEKAERLLNILNTYSIAIQNLNRKQFSSPKDKNRELKRLYEEQYESIRRLLTTEEYERWQSVGSKRNEQLRSKLKEGRKPSPLKDAVLGNK